MNTSDMDKSVEFYENILKVKCSRRFKYKETGLELAQVGDILILSGTNKALEPFRATKATFLVESIIEYRAFLLNNGATIVRD